MRKTWVNHPCSTTLITCIIAQFNPHRLLPIWRENLCGHYHITMTSDNDFCVWSWHYHKRHSNVSVNAQTITCNAPRIRALITSHNDRHIWTDRNSFTGMSIEMIKNAVFFVFFCQKIHKNTQICQSSGDCFGPRYFSSGRCAPSEKYLGPKQSPPIFTQWPQKRWCAVIIV